MRELKFRAWANGYEKWCHNIEYMGDGLWLGYVDDGIGELSTTDIIVEQYTGLKDKSEKEIYEGDIVDYNDDGECIGFVEYDAPEFCLNADATNWARMFLKGAPHQRVIGNIHENHELLSKEEEC